MVGINVSENLKLSPYYRFSQFKGDYDDGAFADAPNNYTASLLNSGVNGHYNYRNGSLHFDYAYDFTTRNYASQYGVFATSGRFHHAEGYVQQNISGKLKMIAGISYQAYSMKDPDTSNSIVSPYASFFLVQRMVGILSLADVTIITTNMVIISPILLTPLY